MEGRNSAEEVVGMIDELVDDSSIPKNVRAVLTELKQLFLSDKEIGVKVDTALQRVEDLSQDPNISSHVRMQLWSLTSVLEGALNR